jgi:hypothetical protein
MGIQNDVLAPGDTLNAGDSLVSSNGLYRLAFQSTGNLYVFLQSGNGGASQGIGVGSHTNSYNFTTKSLTMETTGDLSTNVGQGNNWTISSKVGSYLRILDTGEAVLYKPAWYSGTFSSGWTGWGGSISTLWSGSILDSTKNPVFQSPNGSYQLQFDSQGRLEITGFATPELLYQNSVTAAIAVLQGDNNFVVYPGNDTSNSGSVWRTGTAGAGTWDTHLALSDSGQLILYVRANVIVQNQAA